LIFLFISKRRLQKKGGINMSQMQKVKELLNIFDIKGEEADHEKVLAIGLLLGFNAASAIVNTLGMRFNGSRTEFIESIFKDKLKQLQKFPPQIFPYRLNAEQIKLVLEFYKCNQDLLQAL